MRSILTGITAILLSITTTMAHASFETDQPTVFITGANRGIGLEFVNQFAGRGWNVIATARKPAEAEQLHALAEKHHQIVIEQLDVTDFDRIDELAEKYKDQPFDVLLSNAGITPKYKTAFQRVKGVDWDMVNLSLQVNAIAPLKLAQTFMSNVAASEQKKIIVISSKAGSFELSPKMPMMYGYRGSKAALNMYMYTLSYETPKKDVIVTMLSPGQVNTVAEGEGIAGMKVPNTIEPEESVSKMLAVIDGLTMENNGQFLNYENGELLGW